MAKVFYRPACDAALLSAYRDEVLEAAQRRALEQHLATCPACRQELLRYERLADGLSRLALVPRRRTPSVAMLRSVTASAPGRPWPVHTARTLVSVSLAAVLVAVALVQHVARPTPAMFAAYPPSGASDVSTDTSILITFQRPVDQARVQQTLQIEPPVPFDLSWRSWEQAEIIPLAPLAASTTYTLLAAMPPPSATATVVAVPPSPTATRDVVPQTLTVFHTAPRTVAEGGPAPAIPRRDLFTEAQPVAISQVVLSVPATPSPVPLPEASSPSSPPASQPAAPAGQAATSAADALATTLQQPAMLPPCAPADIFTPVYSSRADIRTALGCVGGTARTVTVTSQAFQRGVLLAVAPDDALYELTTDGLWRAAPLSTGGGSGVAGAVAGAVGPTFRAYWSSHPVLQSSLGTPLSAEDAGQGLLQPFAHGFMLAAAGWTYVADDAGQWQRLVSLLPGDEGTPSDPGGSITGGVPSFPPLRRATAGR